MRVKTFFVLLLIVAIVVAEVNAGAKGGKNEKKGDKKGGKNQEKGKEKNQEKGKNKEGKGGKNKEETVKEEAVNEEQKVENPTEESAKNNEKLNKKEKVKNKKSKRSVEEEPAACTCTQGPVGPAGPQGPMGPPGPAGECITPETTESCSTQNSIFISKPSEVIAIHSQSVAIPECPLGQQKLWQGFSLLGLTANGVTTHTNLGKSDSCLPQFQLSLTTSCAITGTCSESQRNDRTYWLVSNNSLGTEELLAEDMADVVSRCVVCDVRGPVFAVHSQTTEVPTCPSGWDSLWHGFSYISSTTATGSGNNQILSGAGSCLSEVRKPLFIECNPAKESCNVFEGQTDAWLRASNPTGVQVTPTVDGQHISRCNVCLKVA